MSISEELQALETALSAVENHEENTGENEWVVAEELASTLLHEVDREFIAACSPGRIRRLLDALKELQKNGPQVLRGACGDGSDWYGTMAEAWDDALNAASAEAHLGDGARAKLSKAIELLKEAKVLVFDVDAEAEPWGKRLYAFLREAGHE